MKTKKCTFYIRAPAVKRKKHFSDYIVYISIIAVTVFTAAAFVLQFSGLMEISSTLTENWFKFWTAEIISLAFIKNCKTKHLKKKEGEDYGTQGNRFK